MTLGEKLYRLRREKGLSQDQLAEILNVSRQAVSKWERDEAVPETDKVVRLSEIFSVSIDYILKEQPPAGKEALPKETDFFSRLGHLIQTKGYYLGYALTIWGVLDFMKVVIVNIAWKAMTGFLYDASAFSDTTLQSTFNAPLTALWFNVIWAGVKIAAGIFIVLWGKRRSKKTEDFHE